MPSSRFSKSWLVHHLTDAVLEPALRAHARGLLLDIGCGTKPYGPFLAGLPVRHVGIDHPASLHGDSAVDAASSALHLPFRDGAFDCVLCTAVLEHLEEPGRAIEEAFRVLKPGGVALYIAPFIWHVHEEPRDFFRYSRYGLEYLFSKAGFESADVRPLSGFWVTFGQLLVYQLYRLHRGPLRVVPLVPVAGFLIQRFALLLDRLDRRPVSRKWTWAYLAVARKPAPAAAR